MLALTSFNGQFQHITVIRQPDSWEVLHMRVLVLKSWVPKTLHTAKAFNMMCMLELPTDIDWDAKTTADASL